MMMGRESAYEAVPFIPGPVLAVLEEEESWVQFWVCESLGRFIRGIEDFGAVLSPVELQGVISSFVVNAIPNARAFKELQDIIVTGSQTPGAHVDYRA